MADGRDAVWVDVLPSMKDFPGAMTEGFRASSKDIDREAEKVGKQSGGKLGKSVGIGMAAVAGGAVAAGKALYDVGATFDDMADSIRVGTGATGDDLDALVTSAKTVGTQVPAEYDKIGQTVADVNTRLGLTGPTLEKFSAQTLEAGRILGEELDINAASGAFSVFRLEGDQLTAGMDTLFRVSQDTGVGMNELSNLVSKAGPAVQALGFDFDQTAALIGGLDKAGLDASKMTMGLSRSLTALAKDGEDPQEAFQRVTGEIQGFIDKGDMAGAVDLAGKVFGTRNAPQFLQALQEGALSMEDLTSAAEGSGDTILGAADDTADFAEQWDIFKNRGLLLIEPIASRVFGIIGEGMGWINDVGIPAIAGFIDQARSGEGPLGGLGLVVQGIGGYFRDVWWPVIQAIGDFFMTTLVPAIQNVGGIIQDKLLPPLQRIGEWIQINVLPALRSFVDFIIVEIIPRVSSLVNDVIVPGFSLIAGIIGWAINTIVMPILDALWWFISNVLAPVFSWLWQNIIAPVFDGIVGAISWFSENWDRIFPAIAGWLRDTFGPAFTWLNDNIVQPVFNAFVSAGQWVKDNILSHFTTLKDNAIAAFETMGQKIGEAWEAIKAAAAAPVNFVIETVYNDGIKRLIDGVVDVFGGDPLPRIAPIAFASGGSLRRGEAASSNRPVLWGEVPGTEEFYIPINGSSRSRSLLSMAAAKLGMIAMAAGGWVRPARGVITSNYGMRIHPVTGQRKFHDGVDIAAPMGTPISAANQGVVTQAGYYGTLGNYVQLNHGAITTGYGHMSRILSAVGQAVQAGQLIGLMGSTGRSTGSHVHWKASRNGGSINPLSLVGSGEIATTDGGGGGLWLLEIPGKIRDLSAKLAELASDTGLGRLLSGMGRSLIDRAAQWVGSKIGLNSSDPDSRDADKHDQGGWLMPGWSTVQNATGKPEAVLTAEQWRIAETALSLLPMVRDFATADRPGSAFGWPEALRIVGTLDTDMGPAKIAGVAQAVYDDNRAFEGRLARQGAA